MNGFDAMFWLGSARRPRVPAWAKAEQMERSVPQRVLWNCAPTAGDWF